jgi:site-specific DNA-methyltransferase (adenine-specific)/modification methylase
MRKEVLAEGVEVWLGDCREILPTLAPVDAVVTDPPYGIGESAARNKTRGKLTRPGDYGADEWDMEPCPQEIIDWILQNSRWQIIFGGNYFALPPTSCWLIWDKQNTGDFADAELAWTNLPKAVRMIHWMWNGMIRKGNEKRIHLTQKPLGVMKWCLGHLPSDARVILDPFMGSGTTGVACVEKGVSFIGIEREPKYFTIACDRISAALAAPPLFIERPSPPQGSFL